MASKPTWPKPSGCAAAAAFLFSCRGSWAFAATLERPTGHRQQATAVTSHHIHGHFRLALARELRSRVSACRVFFSWCRKVCTCVSVVSFVAGAHFSWRLW